MGELRAKGVCFRGVLKVLGKLKGERIVAATLDLMPEDFAAQYRAGAIFSGGWYPVGWYRALHRAAQQATGEGPELARILGREATRDDLTGVYRIFLLVASPEFVISKAPLLYSAYYDKGAMQVLETKRGRTRARWTGCVGFDRNIWWDITGGCEATLQTAGACDVVMNIVSGGGDGDTEMELEARWAK